MRPNISNVPDANLNMPAAQVEPASTTAELAEPAANEGVDAPQAARLEEANEADPDAERVRETRRLLSSCSSIPAWLKERYTIPADCTVVHVVHKNHVLPHFQIRLASGKIFEGKTLAYFMMVVYRSTYITYIMS